MKIKYEVGFFLFISRLQSLRCARSDSRDFILSHFINEKNIKAYAFCM